eukprot:2590759-Amphidinium_carterae.1
MHLMRALPLQALYPLLEVVDETCHELVSDLCGIEGLSAVQMRIARLPPHQGGIGMPCLLELAPMVRAVTLYKAA